MADFFGWMPKTNRGTQSDLIFFKKKRNGNMLKVRQSWGQSLDSLILHFEDHFQKLARGCGGFHDLLWGIGLRVGGQRGSKKSILKTLL